MSENHCCCETTYFIFQRIEKPFTFFFVANFLRPTAMILLLYLLICSLTPHILKQNLDLILLDLSGEGSIFVYTDFHFYYENLVKP